MLRMLRDEKRVILAIMALWLTIIGIVWGLAWLTMGKAHAAPKAECTAAAPLMAQLKASGFEHEVISEGLVLLKVIAVLKENASAPFPMPDKIVVVFIGREAKIGLIAKDCLRSVITAPADHFRRELKGAKGSEA